MVDGACAGVLYLSNEDGTLATQFLLLVDTGGRPPLVHPHILQQATEMQWSLELDCLIKDMEFRTVPPKRDFYGAGVQITEGATGEGGYLPELGRRAFHGTIRTCGPGSGFSRCGIEIEEHGD